MQSNNSNLFFPFFLFLLLLLASILSAVSSSSPTSPSSNSTNRSGTTKVVVVVHGGCPAILPFPFWLRRQCPVLEDTRCANAFPSDVPPPVGQLNCALANAQPNARLRQLSARELLAVAKQRDPYGRPMCMLTLFYAPDCVFSAKVADTFFRAAPLLPKLRVAAVDVSVGGKGTESLISHYGISSTPVIALWQDGFPRYRLYDDYARLDALLRVLRTHTDLRPLARAAEAPNGEEEEQTKMRAQQQKHGDEEDRNSNDDGAGAADVQHQQRLNAEGEQVEENAMTREEEERRSPAGEPTHDEFLAQFHYLKEHLGFDWYLFAATVTCLVNCLYFIVSSNKGRALLRRHFPNHFAVIFR